MAAQPIPFDALGENGRLKRFRVPGPAWSQQYLQTSATAVSAIFNTILQVNEEPRSEATLQHDSTAMLELTRGADIEIPYTTANAPVVREIDAVRAGSEDEVVPTDFAYMSARSVVESAYGQLPKTLKDLKRQYLPLLIPSPLVTTDDVGGIRLLWRAGNRQVRANFGARPDLRSYLYFESGLEHDMEPLDAQHLAGRLAWLTGR
jgi:hypothetical protein